MPAPLTPPKEWFDHPGSIPTDKRVTIGDDGRVYGYVALWDSCHTGLDGCVKPPRTGDYSVAHSGETLTEDGTIIATANIGGGVGHAAPNNPAPAEFYANTGTRLMRVRYGEDDNGIWFAGALWPETSELDVATIRASSVSGDWRAWRHVSSFRKTRQGHHVFVGSCLVNMPGYPMQDSPAGTPVFITASSASSGTIIEIEEERENTMCDNCTCGKNAVEEPKCPCGAKPAAECAGECGKNIQASPVAEADTRLEDALARIEALEQNELKRQALLLADEVTAD